MLQTGWKKTNMSFRKLQLLFISVLSLAGCKSMAEQPMVDAVIKKHSEESMAEIHSIVTQALNVKKILLAPDALTQSNRLIIERKMHRTLQQGVLMGRSEEMPEIFKLKLKGKECILFHPASNRSWPLLKNQCKTFTSS